MLIEHGFQFKISCDNCGASGGSPSDGCTMAVVDDNGSPNGTCVAFQHFAIGGDLAGAAPCNGSESDSNLVCLVTACESDQTHVIGPRNSLFHPRKEQVRWRPGGRDGSQLRLQLITLLYLNSCARTSPQCVTFFEARDLGSQMMAKIMRRPRHQGRSQYTHRLFSSAQKIQG